LNLINKLVETGSKTYQDTEQGIMQYALSGLTTHAARTRAVQPMYTYVVRMHRQSIQFAN